MFLLYLYCYYIDFVSIYTYFFVFLHSFTNLVLTTGANKVKAQTTSFALRSTYEALSFLGSEGSYVQAPTSGVVAGSDLRYSFIIKPLGVALNPNTVLKLDVPFGFAFYNKLHTCKLFGDISDRTSYGTLSSSSFHATDYSSLYISITGYLLGTKIIRLDCEST